MTQDSDPSSLQIFSSAPEWLLRLLHSFCHSYICTPLVNKISKFLNSFTWGKTSLLLEVSIPPFSMWGPWPQIWRCQSSGVPDCLISSYTGFQQSLRGLLAARAQKKRADAETIAPRCEPRGVARGASRQVWTTTLVNRNVVPTLCRVSAPSVNSALELVIGEVIEDDNDNDDNDWGYLSDHPDNWQWVRTCGRMCHTVSCSLVQNFLCHTWMAQPAQ